MGMVGCGRDLLSLWRKSIIHYILCYPKTWLDFKAFAIYFIEEFESSIFCIILLTIIIVILNQYFFHTMHEK